MLSHSTKKPTFEEVHVALDEFAYFDEDDWIEYIRLNTTPKEVTNATN